MKLNNMKAILFDSGKVLNFPKTGHWFISPGFFNQVDKEIFENISYKSRSDAFSKAGKYINSISAIKTEEEEYNHFIEFYKIFSYELPELLLEEESICELARDLVFNSEKYQFYEDALRVVPLLHKNYKLAVVSDAWPSLEEVFTRGNLRSYFSSFVISSIMGTSKPDAKMFLTALQELHVSPEQSIFIDDNINNCLGAKKIGISAVLLCRDKKHYRIEKIRSIGKGYRVIHSLDELLDI